VGQRVSQSIPQARSKTPTSPKSISSSSPPNAAALGYCIKSEDDFPSPDLNGRANNDELDDSERRQQVDDELLALMMDAFPNLDPHEIAKIIKQERQMIAPLEDRNLLQDLVAIKLTNLTRGNANELEYSNIKMMKAGDPEEKDGFSNSGMPSDPVGHIPFGKPAQNQRASQDPSSLAIQAHAMISSQPAMNADGTPKFRQTILRSELESFLLMASISLIRKFFTIQGIECNICHIPSTVVNISVSLTESFMRTLDSLAPIESSPITPAEDIFEFERIVELFKKYVYSNGSDLRSRAVGTDPKLLATGYKYDISFRKSAHHFKMENNHAIIEDLNSFARLQNIPQTSFYGVFDGHGGYLVSEYLSLHLAYNIAKLPIFAKNIPEAIRLGFKNTDELVLRKMQRDKIKGGSTAVIAILRENVLHVAWAGDARCVVFRRIGQNLVAFPIVNPHNPQGTEKARVVKAGGFVEFIAGKWRVNGRLAVTRSFGDDNLKPIVTAEPEMAKFPLNGDEQFLMLSCDGLYDVMDYSDVAECLDNYIRKGMKMGQLAAALVTEGVTRHSTDDITGKIFN
jgi:serine/threonine protein phosphatase PrpC